MMRMDIFNKTYDSIKKNLILEDINVETMCSRLREQCYSLGYLWGTLEDDTCIDGYNIGKYWKKYGLVICRIYCEFKGGDYRTAHSFWISLGNKLDDLEYSTPDFESGPDDSNGITAALESMLADTSIETNKDLREFRDEVVRMAKNRRIEEDIDADIAAAFSDLKSIHI